jgi:hypothetical protein
MKKVWIYLIVILLFLPILSFGQEGFLVDKDYRIAKYEDTVIEFLIKKQQFDVNKMPFKTSDYEGKIYVRKCLEIYVDSSKSVLLAQFGSLGSPTEEYWALLTSEHFFFFRKMNDLEFQRFTRQYDSKATAVVTTYIKQVQPSVSRKRRRMANRTIIDEKTGIVTKVSL